jgi:predicted 3-demethylubiquinone-9 3-methyltransferase (glyoxalase superfamily)
MEANRFEEVERLGRDSGKCPGGQAEMSENFGHLGGSHIGGDDLQNATDTMAVFSWLKTRYGLAWQLNHPEEL